MEKTIKTIIFLVILAVGGWFLYTNFMKPLDVEGDLKMTEAQLAAKYHSSFSDNKDMAGRVPQYSDPEKITISVRSDGTFDVIYANGEQIGVGTADRRAHAYDIKMGDADEKAGLKIAFQHDMPFEILNDLADGHSTATFFPNESQNTCFVYVRSNVTGRLIYMAYYTDLTKISGLL